MVNSLLFISFLLLITLLLFRIILFTHSCFSDITTVPVERSSNVLLLLHHQLHISFFFLLASLLVILLLLFLFCRFRRANRIFAGLWFGKGKPHFPTFLQPFSLAIRELYHKGINNDLSAATWQRIIMLKI